MLALFKSYWAAMNKLFLYARPCVNKDFFVMTCSAVFFVSFPKNPKIDGNDEKLSRFCGTLLLPNHSNQQQKRWRCFTNNRAWLIRWKVCRKDWHLSGKRPQIGLSEISNLYKVSSVFNVCLSFTKQVNYKVSSITKNYALLSSSNNPTEAWKTSLAITRQIAQEDINLLLTKTTAARSSQEAVMTSQCS